MADIVQRLAWQAGMFEGEGSIMIGRPRSRSLGSMHVDVANTDRSIVEDFHEMWGGSISHAGAKGTHREFWRWRLAANQAAWFLMAMWPLLHTDKYSARAVLAIDFQDQKKLTGGVVSYWYVQRQWDFYEEMKELNIRGVRSAPDA